VTPFEFFNAGEKDEEWFRQPATLGEDFTVSAQLPAGTTHYVINLIDENNFLNSYPEVIGLSDHIRSKTPFSTMALAVE
jgi:hypothetical protein